MNVFATLIGLGIFIFSVVRCWQIAEYRKWSTTGAIVLGILFGIFALIGYGIAVLVNKE